MSGFEQIAAEHRPRLVRIARRYVGNAAEDVAQVALLKAWQAIGTFDGRNLAGWLDEIARNTALDYLRRVKRRPEAHTDGSEWPEAAQDAHEGTARDIERACVLLTTKQRAAVAMSAQGYTYPEIGAALGCSHDAARDRVNRARAIIREFLA